ncbi:MAG: HAD hydrolase-like protein [Gemmatimonadaceae bacterium]|nr:HAD hydrolase-like protein [Gemmatimonadaceae bacterium]
MSRRVIDTILMEFDGVLADTAEARRHAMLSVLLEDSISLQPDDYHVHCAGLPTADAVQQALDLLRVEYDETGIELLALRVDRAFSAHLGKGLTLAEGAREVVERLAAQARVGIVSRANRRDIEFALTLARIESHVAVVIGAEDVYPPKPSPAPYQAALRRLEHRRPMHADGIVVALEDSQSGIRSASAAGLRCIGVGRIPAHIALEADALIPAIAGLDVRQVEQLVAHEGERFA